MTIRLNGSTSGYTEIDAPAVAGSNTITLPTGAGSAYQVMRNGATAGSLEFTDKIVSGTAQNSTSGTSIDFTGIPSWVKRVTVMFNGVSTNGTSAVQVQIGAGSVLTSGYSAIACGYSGTGLTTGNYTSGFGLEEAGSATYTRGGSLILSLLSANTWSCQGGIFRTTNVGSHFYGAATLSGTLDRVRITTANGTDTFDAGSINILYE
jgi:hypothetical protein